MISKPLLAGVLKNIDNITYPVLVSPKLDGIRCMVLEDETVQSRTGKPIPNDHIRTTLQDMQYMGFDGELVTFDDDGNIDEFNDIQSKVMRHDGKPNFAYLVFDSLVGDEDEGFESRWLGLIKCFRDIDAEGGHDFLKLVPHFEVNSKEHLLVLEQRFVDDGYEGLMLRSMDGVYKQGRSTEKQGILLKLKRFADAEGKVWGWKQLIRKDGTAEEGMAGVLVVSTEEWGLVEIGTGFTQAQRKSIACEFSEQWAGKRVTFQYQECGMKNAPRFPSFKGFRPEDA